MENKKKNITVAFVLIVIIVVVGVFVSLVFDRNTTFEPSGTTNVIASLSGETQAEIDELIKEDLEKNRYKLSNAKVYLDPYGSAPLSALIAFITDSETDVTVTIKGKNDDDITLKSGSAREHYVPIYGLYADYQNEVEVTLGTGEKKTITIETQGLDGMPVATVNQANATDNALYFFTSPLAMTSFALDGHGEVRWLIDELYYHAIKELDNGHLLIGTDEINDQDMYTRLIEIDYLGRLYNEYDIDTGYLNDFFVKEDGNIIVASKKTDRDTFSDYIIEIDGETGKVVKTWDILETLKAVDTNITSKITGDRYFYNSGIEYYPESNSLLLTYWGGEFVINLSYNDGSIKWIFSDPDNFTSRFDSLLLKGEGDFVYPMSMHSATLDGNTLRVFDNGYSTNSGETDTANLTGSYSSANTYTISGNNIKLISSVNGDKKLFSYALGDYTLVSSTDELILFGRELKGLDRSRSGNINDYEHLYSKLIEKKDGAVVLDMDVDWATHTVDKIVLGTSEFNFDSPESYTTLEPAKKGSITGEILAMISKAEDSVPYEFGYSKSMIEHDILFMSTDEVKLILLNEEKEGAVYTLKEKTSTGLKKIVTDLAKDKYYIYVLENGVMYTTDKFIEIR